MSLIVQLFPNLRTRKTWLKKCLKSVVSEDPLTSNMVRETKHCGNLNTPSFPYLLITVKPVELEKASLSDMQNLRTVFKDIVCRLQAFFAL